MGRYSRERRKSGKRVEDERGAIKDEPLFLHSPHLTFRTMSTSPTTSATGARIHTFKLASLAWR